jgi:hypothetical protein
VREPVDAHAVTRRDRSQRLARAHLVLRRTALVKRSARAERRECREQRHDPAAGTDLAWGSCDDAPQPGILDRNVRDPARAPPGRGRAARERRSIRVAVNSDSWSNVEVDGVAAGSTPLTIELAPGRHKFRAAMADGRVVEKEFEVTVDRNRVTLR